jgi:predicted RNase H-like HicB family nuclease
LPVISAGGVVDPEIDMEIKLTAVFRKFPEGYAAFVGELPGANTQCAALEEARENLKEAMAMVLQANIELAKP